jgi:protein phosphatase
MDIESEIVTHFHRQFAPLLRLLPEEIAKVGTRIPIPAFDAAQISDFLDAVTPCLNENSQAVFDIHLPAWIIGDLHGNFHDLLRILTIIGPVNTHPLIFLGDYVDRGSYSTEILLLLYTLKFYTPWQYIFLRGNHEFRSVNELYGFRQELDSRFPETTLFDDFNNSFTRFPFAAVLGASFVCLHGGIGPAVASIKQIRQLQLPIHDSDGQPVVTQVVWSDPTRETQDYIGSARGSGSMFGAGALLAFLRASKCRKMIRAHECVMHGVAQFAYSQGLTVFSCSNYNGRGNRGAFLFVPEDGVFESYTLEPIAGLVQRPDAVYAPVCPIGEAGKRFRTIAFDISTSRTMRMQSLKPLKGKLGAGHAAINQKSQSVLSPSVNRKSIRGCGSAPQMDLLPPPGFSK